MISRVALAAPATKNSVELIICTDFCLEKTDLACCKKNLLNFDKHVVPNKAILEGKFSEN